MIFTAEKISLQEVETRQNTCRQLLQKSIPQASGFLLFSRTNIYYLTGTRANGILWLPLQGEAVLMVRKGEERCKLESPVKNIVSFKSYSEVPKICHEMGSPLGSCIAAEMRALPWSLAHMLQERLKDISFVSADNILDKARSIKSAYELQCLRHAGAAHHKVLHELLPEKIKPGFTERQIAHSIWELSFAHNHGGMLRMDHYGEDIFLGRIAAGTSALYPSPFNGPLGTQGEHPALPYMGYAGNVWEKDQVLMVDTGFVHKGYHSDCSVTYFAGQKSALPNIVQKAQHCCQEILMHCQENLKPGANLQDIWLSACSIAKKAGFQEGFMGNGLNKVSFLGHGIGLAMDEWPAIHNAPCLVETHMAFAIEPKIALPSIGMVGTEEVFIITNEGTECITGHMTDIICINTNN